MTSAARLSERLSGNTPHHQQQQGLPNPAAFILRSRIRQMPANHQMRSPC
jgi:hypothetical protein